MTYQQTQELESQYVMHTFGRSVEFVSGQGMTLTDTQGKTYTDFLAGIAVCSLGHCHPVLTKAIQDQAEKLIHVSNYFYIEHRAEVAKLINDAANKGFTDHASQAAGTHGESSQAQTSQAHAPVWKTFFANSGAEANECAMKLARLRAKRNGTNKNTIVCLKGSFHGRTLETVAATMQDWLQDPFQPLPGGFVACERNNVEELRAIFATNPDICAVMLEPVQGESGVHPMTQEFMEAVRELCDANDAMMICDEVQTGVYRCGKPFAFQVYGVTPDIFTMAKGIAGGFPMGACVAQAQVADVFKPGDHGSTFGGSNLACAAAHAVMQELESGNYDAHAQEMGAYLREKLETIPQIVETRGLGLLVGAELAAGLPDAHDIMARMLEAGFVINATGPTTLRLLPPLVVEKEHCDALVAALGTVLAEA